MIFRQFCTYFNCVHLLESLEIVAGDSVICYIIFEDLKGGDKGV